MKCNYNRENIVLYLYKELNRIEEKRFLEHIDECSSCRKELEENKTLFNIIDETEESTIKTDWEEHWKIIENKVSSKNRRGIFLHPVLKWSAAAAASFVLLISGFMAGRYLFTPHDKNIYSGERSGDRTKLVYVRNYFEDVKPLLLDYANYSPAGEINGGPVDKEIIDKMLNETRLLKRRIPSDKRPYLSALMEDLEMILIEIRNMAPGDKNSVRSLQELIRDKSIPLKIDLFKNKTKQFEKI